MHSLCISKHVVRRRPRALRTLTRSTNLTESSNSCFGLSPDGPPRRGLVKIRPRFMRLPIQAISESAVWCHLAVLRPLLWCIVQFASIATSRFYFFGMEYLPALRRKRPWQPTSPGDVFAEIARLKERRRLIQAKRTEALTSLGFTDLLTSPSTTLVPSLATNEACSSSLRPASAPDLVQQRCPRC
ncbi:hypothetical protein SDRG_04647 [Saprolegnia diclina VS20]|uniref:Uncharacterized protein n=1 Tax=Saprolegnia diclina (strain VS20) TaxID=1156394 RepID=T0QVZ8_SAPDV|nr:hypothetical protein SDRG_04647 [Saprolegnia diclina VS20]EQC38220.1 hypothetical protein SDRG_04647 [Saprolegnia diclina VS20]|eukprot:XP_008608547.1 hypothetical protein SDRG_04647 [Saprolegnia diclina VS20]